MVNVWLYAGYSYSQWVVKQATLKPTDPGYIQLSTYNYIYIYLNITIEAFFLESLDIPPT